MAEFTDQLSRSINLPKIPTRIISVVPSQTELLFHLGLLDEITGITKFCIHPADRFKTTLKIGGTKQLNIELIKQLNPDLIIANKEENERNQVEALMQHFPVWVSDVNNLDEALAMIAGVGQVVGRQQESAKLINQIHSAFTQLSLTTRHLKIAYFIWRKPYMVAAGNTFIDSLLQKCGLTNAFQKDRYPEVTEKMLIEADPDIVLLSSEPYPFSQKHINEFQNILPRANVILVDGEMFSWYGSRLRYAPAYFNQLLKILSEDENK